MKYWLIFDDDGHGGIPNGDVLRTHLIIASTKEKAITKYRAVNNLTIKEFKDIYCCVRLPYLV